MFDLFSILTQIRQFAYFFFINFAFYKALVFFVKNCYNKRVMKTIKILDVAVSAQTFNENLEIALSFCGLNDARCRMIFTPNPEVLVLANRDAAYKKILNAGDLVTADGVGIIIASALLRRRVKERTTGVELIGALFDRMKERGQSVYLLGGKPGVAAAASDNIKKQFAGLNVCGFHHGYFDKPNEPKIISDINKKKPDLLLVGLGFPIQEQWIYANRGQLTIKAAVACGGTLDVFSGKTKRAPVFFRKIGCEWLYRLIKEPKRFFRMLALPKFLVLVLIKDVISEKKSRGL